MAVLTKNLVKLRGDFNSNFPDRDKASDGWIGDAAHQEERSGHNPDRTANAEYKDGDSLDEVRAIDVDDDLNSPNATMEQVIQFLVNKGRNGNLESVIRYIIYNRRIWSSTDGWLTHAYTGASPHTEHAHFSGAYTQSADNNSTYDYQLDEVNMPTVQEIASKISSDLANEDSGIYIGLQNLVLDLLKNTKIPYIGGPGTRITALGWGDLSLMARVDYLFEMIAAAPVTVDGQQESGSIMGRVQRVEGDTAATKDAIEALNTRLSGVEDLLNQILTRLPQP